MLESRTWKALISLVAVCLLMFVYLGIAYSSMRMNGLDNMPACPFMGEMGMCQMTPVEHLAAWQSMFTSTLPPFVALALLMLISLFAFGLQVEFLVPKKQPDQRPAYRGPPNANIFDPLKRAFARGIVHPKIF